MLDVSVIIPAYNAEKTIERAISSLLCQDNEIREILVIINGSTDTTLKICKKIAREHMNVVVVQSKKGVSNARNMGIQTASGKYIGFLDADDYACEDMYSSLVGDMEEHASDLAVCEYYVDQGDGKKVFSNQLYDKNCDAESLQNRILGKISVDEPSFMASVWRCLYRKDIIDKGHIIFPTDLSIGEDVFFNLFYLENVKSITVCDRPLYYYTQGASSVSTNLTEDLWIKYKYFLKKLLEYGNQQRISKEGMSRIYQKIHGLSCWIASMVASSGFSTVKKKYLLNSIIDDRKELLAGDCSSFAYSKTDEWLTNCNVNKILFYGKLNHIKEIIKEIIK